MSKFLHLNEGGEFSCNYCLVVFYLKLIKTDNIHKIFGKGNLVINCPFCDRKHTSDQKDEDK